MLYLSPFSSFLYPLFIQAYSIVPSFVASLTARPHFSLEESCMDHTQVLVDKSLHDEDWIAGHAASGHALMATAVPMDHVREHGMDVKYEHQLPAIPKPDLSRMLNLCASLPHLSREVTPVMAWACILQHPRVVELSEGDVEIIKADLKGKVSCYGYVIIVIRLASMLT
jgi:hypothetical protein